MSDCIDFKEPANSTFSRWARPGGGLDDAPLAPQPISDRAAELTRELRRAWLEKNLEAYVQRLRDLAPEFGYSSRGLARALRITPRHLQRVFAAILGRAPQAWLNEERLLAARRMLQRVKARHHAAALIERADRIDAAGEMNVQVQLRGAGRMRAQQRQRIVVARLQAQHVGAVVEGQREGAFEC